MKVMFDCASPFLATAMGQVYTQHVHRNDKFGYVMDAFVDDKKFAKSDIPFTWGSPIGSRMTQGDINWYSPGMLNKNGKEGKTAWDSFTYMLLMSHNVYQHIESVQRANALADLATQRLDIDWRSFQKAKGKSLEIDPWVPRKILFMNKLNDELFRTENPMSLLEEARP